MDIMIKSICINKPTDTVIMYSKIQFYLIGEYLPSCFPTEGQWNVYSFILPIFWLDRSKKVGNLDANFWFNSRGCNNITDVKAEKWISSMIKTDFPWQMLPNATPNWFKIFSVGVTLLQYMMVLLYSLFWLFYNCWQT